MGAMLLLLLNAAYSRLHWKPLDAAIGQLFAQYCPGSQQGNRIHNNNE
jgi:hypothetical protein